MLEDQAGTLELDLYRGFTTHPDLVDDESWSIELGLGMCDARNVCRHGDVQWLIHGVARLEDMRDIDPIEGWASIEREKVRLVEMLPLTDSLLVTLQGEVEAAETELEGLEDRTQDLRDEIDESAEEDD